MISELKATAILILFLLIFTKFNVVDNVYLIESSILIKKVTILKYSAGLYTVRLESGGGIRVRENRLFRTEEEAKTKQK